MTTPASLKLITLGLRGVIADIDGPSHIERIIAASPLAEHEVRKVLQDQLRLKTLSSKESLTAELADEVCRRLRISREELLFGQVPCAPYRIRLDATAAVQEAAELAPVVLLANVSVFADPALDPVRERIGQYLSGECLSWRIGAAKPDPALFEHVLNRHGVEPEQLAHVGASWREDIAPVLNLGGRAVWINPDGKAAPSLKPVPLDRVLVATSLGHAMAQVRAQWNLPVPARTGSAIGSGG